MSKQLRVAVVSPWYPTPDQPNAGSFVAAQVEALVEANATVTVFHLDAVPASTLVSGSDADLFNAMPTESYSGWVASARLIEESPIQLWKEPDSLRGRSVQLRRFLRG